MNARTLKRLTSAVAAALKQHEAAKVKLLAVKAELDDLAAADQAIGNATEKQPRAKKAAAAAAPAEKPARAKKAAAAAAPAEKPARAKKAAAAAEKQPANGLRPKKAKSLQPA